MNKNHDATGGFSPAGFDGVRLFGRLKSASARKMMQKELIGVPSTFSCVGNEHVLFILQLEQLSFIDLK